VSDHATILAAAVAKLEAAQPAGCRTIQASDQEAFVQLARTPPAYGPVYAGREFEEPKVRANSQQSAEWGWDLFVMGRLPAANVPAGTDVFSLLEASYGALNGLQPAGMSGVRLTCVNERLVDVLSGALLYVQSWQHWRAPQ